MALKQYPQCTENAPQPSQLLSHHNLSRASHLLEMPDKAIVTCLFVQIFMNESKKPSGFHVCHPTRVLRCFLGFDPFPVCVQCGLGALPEFGSSMRPGHLYGMSFTEAGSES